MTQRAVFVSRDGRPRALWRILLFLVVALVLTVVVAVALRPLLQAADRLTGIDETSDGIALSIALVGAHAIMLRWVDRRPWSHVWLGSEAGRRRTLAAGALLGAAPIAATCALLLAVGWLDVQPAAGGSWWSAAIRVSAALAPAAAYEELLSRGYVLAAAADGMGMPAAVLVTSAAFGLLHLSNPGATWQPIALVSLAGVFLATVLLATRSLYAACAAHFAWNWVMAVPLHVAVSGVPVPRPGYETIEDGPDWVTGGPWGPEGGAAAAAAMLAGMAFLYVRRQRTRQT